MKAGEGKAAAEDGQFTQHNAIGLLTGSLFLLRLQPNVSIFLLMVRRSSSSVCIHSLPLQSQLKWRVLLIFNDVLQHD
jgi:hypothetical protein